MFKSVLCVLFIFPFITHFHIAIAKKADNNFVLSSVIHKKTVRSYPLTENFLSKMEKIKKEMVGLFLELEVQDTRYDNIIEKMIISVSSFQQLRSILIKNNLTPRDFVIGFITLQETLAAVTYLKYNKAFSYKKNIVSLSNLMFGKKHIDRISAILSH
ncbi:hypothetical protein V3565_03455 [Bartonella sp. B10]